MITVSKVLLRNSSISALKKYLNSSAYNVIPRTLMILRLDEIGDYILFRNFLKSIRESEKYRDCKITLCGNERWKDLAETFDSKYVDDFIWIDRSRFLKRTHWTYTYSKQLDIHSRGFETLIDPNEIRTKLTDFVKDHSGIPNRIENNPIELSGYKERIALLKKSHSAGTEKTDGKELFQFNINRKFVEELTESDPGVDRLDFPVDRSGGRIEYIILFPGAGSSIRMWSVDKFAEVCKLIRRKSRIKIIVCGGVQDKTNAEEIISKAGIDNIENFAGITSLPQLVNLISRAELLISNETCAVHIAASVDTKTICVSNANHFGRFNPYPVELADGISTIYPEEVRNRLHDFHGLAEAFAVGSDIDINSISSEEVYMKALELLDGR